MKSILLLALFFSLGTCLAAGKPDPRTAQIHAMHQQLLVKQNALAAQAKNPALVANGGNGDAKRIFSTVVQESQANLTALDQLSPAKASDPAQVALVGELLAKEKELLERGSDILARNESFLARTAKQNGAKKPASAPATAPRRAKPAPAK